VIKVKCSGLSLQRKLVKCPECIKGKYGLWPVDGRWEPTCTKQLRASVEYKFFAVAEIDGDVVDTRGIKHHEIRWARSRQGTSQPTMAELKSQTKASECDLVKELPCPFLKRFNGWNKQKQFYTYFYPAQR
jgi:hypothetical protein